MTRSPRRFCTVFLPTKTTTTKTDDEEEETRSRFETDLDLTILLHDDTFCSVYFASIVSREKKKTALRKGAGVSGDVWGGGGGGGAVRAKGSGSCRLIDC